MAEENIKTKVCTSCGEEKELKFFYFRPDINDYRAQCKKCHKGWKEDGKEKSRIADELYAQGKKECTMCGEIKNISEYNKHVGTRFGLSPKCKDCLTSIRRQEHNVYSRARYTIKIRYGASDEDVDRIMNSHVCEICGDVFNSKVLKNIDHDHSNGSVRGALCRSCNLGIASLKESPNRMKSAINYLKKYSTHEQS